MQINSKLVNITLNLLPLKYFYKIKLLVLFCLEQNPLISKAHGKYSQNEEDNILENIIKMIGTIPKTFIEFGVGNGFENNTLNP